MQKKEYSMEIGGKTLTAEFSDLTERANGSVILKYGKTVVLATAVMSKHQKEGLDFFPLTVDYEEKYYAAGQILGGRFMKREGRPSDEAILSGRVIDRTIRPLFEQHIRREIQVVTTVLSISEDDPDVLAVIAASLALGVSNIPWNGPVSAIRLGKHLNNESIEINPTYEFRDHADAELETIISGKDGDINMVEIATLETNEDVIEKIFKKSVGEIEKIQEFQKKIIAEIGQEKVVIEKEELSKESTNLFKKEITPKLDGAVFAGPGNDTINDLRDQWLDLFKTNFAEESKSVALDYYEETVNDLLHSEAVAKDRRADNRKMDEVRNLYAQAGGLTDVLHGSGIFYRGGTHVLSVLTLGGPKDAQVINGIEVKEDKSFMHHYNFPPYSVGETGRMGGTNRRMIGHGNLAERALSGVLPQKADFPYTIRIVSESMASNGSTSMASVCAGTLSMMDAGVPIKAPVAGVAMGLMMENKDSYKILTDIQGPEDHHGDMDFKVAGTKNGVTALQMDIKVGSIPVDILVEALEHAKKARLKILEVIEKEIPAPRKEIALSAPKILVAQVKEDQIGLIIGPGGKTINGIKDKTGVEGIDIEDDGTVYITGKNGSAEEALTIISDMTREYKAGEKFEGKVAKVLDFGVFVNIGYNTDGLVHISEIAPFRINEIGDKFKEGDIVPVIIKEVDEKKRINLSIKAIDPSFAEKKGFTPPTISKETPLKEKPTK